MRMCMIRGWCGVLNILLGDTWFGRPGHFNG